MQAITTKYLGPTDTKGGRIKARCQAGSRTVGYPYDSRDRDHAVACAALLKRLGWTGDWVSGGLPDGTGDAFVCADNRRDRTTVNGIDVDELLEDK